MDKINAEEKSNSAHLPATHFLKQLWIGKLLD